MRGLEEQGDGVTRAGMSNMVQGEGNTTSYMRTNDEDVEDFSNPTKRKRRLNGGKGE